eukprot:GHVU01095576.1.p1 GENE.GHVU01095576.1~~GHVU01095576.1.p1  ORF type:complete len:117 (+),score=6.82 GHVU01095576.1:111-461(+)
MVLANFTTSFFGSAFHVFVGACRAKEVTHIAEGVHIDLLSLGGQAKRIPGVQQQEQIREYGGCLHVRGFGDCRDNVVKGAIEGKGSRGRGSRVGERGRLGGGGRGRGKRGGGGRHE